MIPFKMRKIIFLGLIFLLTSCSYSTIYHASYTVQNQNSTTDTKDITVHFIENIANENQLTRDNKYFDTDTLGYFGKPYHYFKFWLEQKDSITIIKFDYNGVFGNRKNPPYRILLSSLTDSIQKNFRLIDEEIKETNNAKKSRQIK